MFVQQETLSSLSYFLVEKFPNQTICGSPGTGIANPDLPRTQGCQTQRGTVYKKGSQQVSTISNERDCDVMNLHYFASDCEITAIQIMNFGESACFSDGTDSYLQCCLVFGVGRQCDPVGMPLIK